MMKRTTIILITCLLLSISQKSISQTPGDFRSNQSGAWESAASWQTFNGSIWVNASAAPLTSNGKISILPGHSITSSTSITGDQVIINIGGTLNIAGGIFTANDGTGDDVDCKGTLILSAGLLNGNGSVRLTSGSKFNWSGGIIGGSGSVSVNAGAVFLMEGSSHYLSDTKAINNSGIWTWTGGPLTYYNSSSIISNSGTFNINTDNDVTGSNSSTAIFVNKPGGIINKIGSPSDETYFYNFNSFINGGTINVNSSKMRFYTNVTDSGITNVALGAHIHFTGGNTVFNIKAVLRGAGNLHFDGAINTSNTSAITLNNINISSGTLTLTKSINIKGGSTFNINAGVLNGNGTVTFSPGSTLNWTGGTIGGSGAISINPGVAFYISGGYHYLSDSKNINNYGLCTWTGGVLYYNNSSGVINNAGTFNINTDDDISGFNSSTASFINMPGGIINKIGSPTDETSFGRLGPFINSGTVNVNSGRIRLYTMVVDSGTINVASGAGINFSSDFTSFSKGAVLNGAGSIYFDGTISTLKAVSVSVKHINLSGGALTLTPSLTINSGCTLTISGGTLNGTGSVKFASGSNFYWMGGTIGGSGSLTINPGASFTMSYTTHYLSDSKTINNSGSWMWTGGALYYYNSNSIINNNGILNIFTDDDVIGANSATATFNNKQTGIINKIGSPSDESSFNNISLFSNNGTINVNSGKMKFYASSIDSGTINVALGAGINYSGGIARFSPASVIKGAGNLHFEGSSTIVNTTSVSVNNINVSSGTLSLLPSIARVSGSTFTISGGVLNGTGSVSLDSGSKFNWLGGTIGGSGNIDIKRGAAFSMSEGFHFLSDTKNIDNSGIWTWTGGPLYYYNSSSVISNGGTFNITTDNDVTGSNSNTASFNNKAGGIINKTGSLSDETYFYGISSFNNNGTVNINSGNLTLYNNGIHSGLYKIANDAQLRGLINLPFTGSSFTNNGTVTLNGLSFTGSAVQALKGTGKINTLSINNTRGLMLGGTQTINTALNLIKEKITLGNNDLLLGPSAILSGGSDSSYIITNGTGSLGRRVNNDSAGVLFPVGTDSSYRPAICQLSRASTTDDFKVRVMPNLYGNYDIAGKPKGGVINSNVVNGTWIISEVIPGGSRATLFLQWNSGDEATGFKRTGIRLGNYVNNDWVLGTAQAAVGSSPFTIANTNISTFSLFGVINQFISSVNTFAPLCKAVSFIVPYKAVGNFTSGNVFTAQLSDSSGSFNAPVNIGSVTSTSSGSITVNIPGSTRAASGYRIRVISSNPSLTGPDNATDITINSCNSIVASYDKSDQLPGDSVSSVVLPYITQATGLNPTTVKISTGELSAYPNPNNGRFTLALTLKEAGTRYAVIEIINSAGGIMHVEKIHVSSDKVNKIITLPVTCSPGIYIIRVVAGKAVFFDKIIISGRS